MTVPAPWDGARSPSRMPPLPVRATIGCGSPMVSWADCVLTSPGDCGSPVARRRPASSTRYFPKASGTAGILARSDLMDMERGPFTRLRILRGGDAATNSESREVVLRLVLQPEPGHRPVLRRPRGVLSPFFIGDRTEDLLCGNCDHLLAHSVERESLPRLVLQCPSCEYYNDTE